MQFFIATLLSTFYASSSAWTVPRLSSKGGCPFSLMRSTTADATSLGEGPKPEFLLDRIGGDVALEAAVDELYERLIVDESLAVYFDGVPMNKLKQHQFNFMRIAFTEIPEDLDVAGMLTEGHSRLWEMVRTESTMFVAFCFRIVMLLLVIRGVWKITRFQKR